MHLNVQQLPLIPPQSAIFQQPQRNSNNVLGLIKVLPSAFNQEKVSASA
jgi:hypothetical protein